MPLPPRRTTRTYGRPIDAWPSRWRRHRTADHWFDDSQTTSCCGWVRRERQCRPGPEPPLTPASRQPTAPSVLRARLSGWSFGYSWRCCFDRDRSGSACCSGGPGNRCGPQRGDAVRTGWVTCRVICARPCWCRYRRLRRPLPTPPPLAVAAHRTGVCDRLDRAPPTTHASAWRVGLHGKATPGSPTSSFAAAPSQVFAVRLAIADAGDAGVCPGDIGRCVGRTGPSDLRRWWQGESSYLYHHAKRWTVVHHRLGARTCRCRSAYPAFPSCRLPR